MLWKRTSRRRDSVVVALNAPWAVTAEVTANAVVIANVIFIVIIIDVVDGCVGGFY